MWKLGVLILSLFCSLQSVANTGEQQRKNFLAAEKFLDNKDEKAYLRVQDSLKSYPLGFYLEYRFLSKHLSKQQAIQSFLKEHKESRYARKLRWKWLKYVYQKKQWSVFVSGYQPTRNTAMQCKYQWARYQLNYKTSALKAAQKIWLTGHSLPASCDALLNKLSNSSFLTQSLIFQRFELAIKAKEFVLARFLQKKLKSKSTRKLVGQWEKLVKNPELIKNNGFLKAVQKKQRAKMIVYAMKRFINKDTEKAVRYWDGYQSTFKLSKAQRYQVERKMALQLAFDKSSQAYERFSRLDYSKDASVRTWAVRAALIEGNWAHVQIALNKLSKAEQKKSRWRYWQARTFSETKQPDKAQKIWQKLANERSYHGFIAADRLKQAYSLEDNPIEVTDAQKMALLASKDFAVINEFRLVKKVNLAQLYWSDSLSRLKGADLLVAAKIAQQWGWNKLAILTVAKAKNWDDVVLRFPMEYQEQVQKNAQKQSLPLSIIYGLIRRESMFDPNANSPVGALGLMQIMPATGKKIMQDLKQKWRSKSVLLHAPTNVKFGAFYYKQMLDKFNGHFALAAAAYNAGPHRVTRWLGFKKHLPADIWIETIPYKETRGYVTAVLAYAAIYRARLNEVGTFISDFMLDVSSLEERKELLLVKNK